MAIGRKRAEHLCARMGIAIDFVLVGALVPQACAITLLTATATLLLTSAANAQNPVKRPLPALIITPLSSMAFAGPQGGPFSPPSFQYHLSASEGTIRYSIRTPSWLTASSVFGATDTRGVTLTLTINTSASGLAPRAYKSSVAFTNVTNGQGSGTRATTLIIRTTSGRPSQPAGYLKDDHGNYLLDDRAGRLQAQ